MGEPAYCRIMVHYRSKPGEDFRRMVPVTEVQSMCAELMLVADVEKFTVHNGEGDVWEWKAS